MSNTPHKQCCRCGKEMPNCADAAAMYLNVVCKECLKKEKQSNGALHRQPEGRRRKESSC